MKRDDIIKVLEFLKNYEMYEGFKNLYIKGKLQHFNLLKTESFHSSTKKIIAPIHFNQGHLLRLFLISLNNELSRKEIFDSWPQILEKIFSIENQLT